MEKPDRWTNNSNGSSVLERYKLVDYTVASLTGLHIMRYLRLSFVKLRSVTTAEAPIGFLKITGFPIWAR